MDQNLIGRIRERAYEIWLANGCPDGDAERHWLAAERELIQAAAQPAKGTIINKAGRPLRRNTRTAVARIVS